MGGTSTSMGTKAAPSYTNTFMGKFEEDFVYTYPTQPLLWKRYIDDCFFILTGTEDSLNIFLKYLNSCNPNITFTFEKSQHSIHFLDTTVFFKDHELRTDLYSKPTGSHNYLRFTSSHPNKCKERVYPTANTLG